MKNALKTAAVIFALANASIGSAAVYGTDDRKDINEITAVAQQAKAIAITVANNFLTPVNDILVKIDDVPTFQRSSQMCANERFANQPVLDVGTCTGFLIKDKYLLTAGHCILPNGIVNDDSNHPFCEAFSWYFGFNNSSRIQTSNQLVNKNQLVRCKRIIRAENIAGGNDFALMELERSPALPLTLRLADVQLSEKVFTVGHPFGLPAKFSGISQVHSIKHANYFEVNLDTGSGNSGSPVFDMSKKVVGILIEGHPEDFTFDTRAKCNRVNRCSTSAKQCLSNSKFTGLGTSNRIQRLSPALKYLPK